MTENPYQSPAFAPVSIRSGVRTGCGYTLAILGLLVLARLVWLGYWQWSTAFEETWNRFIVLSWLSCVIILIGGWLAFRSRVAMVGAVMAVIGPLALVHALDRFFGI